MTTVLVCHAQIVMAISHGVHEHMFQVAQLRYGERIERACRLKGAYFVFGDVHCHSEQNLAHLWHDACMRLSHMAKALSSERVLRALRIRVLQHHIRDGVRGNCVFCPIALAAKDALPPGPPPHKIVVATPMTLVIGLRVYRLSQPARRFISDYDRFMPVRPFTFIARYTRSLT